MRMRFHALRLNWLTLVALALSLTVGVGCGIGKDELQRDYIDGLKKENAELKNKVTQLESQVESEAKALRADLKKTETQVDTNTKAQITTLDTKYEQYKRDAEVFRSLTDNIDKLKVRNIEVYKRLRDLLEGQKRAIEAERAQLRQRGEILISLAQTLQSILENLAEFTGDGGGGSSDGPR